MTHLSTTVTWTDEIDAAHDQVSAAERRAASWQPWLAHVEALQDDARTMQERMRMVATSRPIRPDQASAQEQ